MKKKKWQIYSSDSNLMNSSLYYSYFYVYYLNKEKWFVIKTRRRIKHK